MEGMAKSIRQPTAAAHQQPIDDRVATRDKHPTTVQHGASGVMNTVFFSEVASRINRTKILTSTGEHKCELLQLNRWCVLLCQSPPLTHGTGGFSSQNGGSKLSLVWNWRAMELSPGPRYEETEAESSAAQRGARRRT
jgi:hypothetical protein